VYREYEVVATPEEIEDGQLQMLVAEAQKVDPTTGVGAKVRVPENVTQAQLGRIAAQTAGQVYRQRLREAERDVDFQQYASREAGSRSKVAVESRQQGVDAKGAAVGQRGSRIQAIVAELNGEKVDVVLWHEDPALYVAEALSPAEVLNVRIDEEHKIANVVVPERQLSLAIGKEGQNARLAAKLTGWRID